jgi:hypothetical protein
MIAATGFADGRTAGPAEARLHVEGDNDGGIGDVGQPLMHVLTRYIRQAHMAEAHIRDREFRAPPAGGGFESRHLASNPLPTGKATPYLESPYRKRDNSKGSTSP